MKNTILIFSLLFWAPMCFAQNISQNDVKVREKTSSTLYVIKLNNGEELSTQELIVGPSEIQSLSPLRKPAIIQLIINQVVNCINGLIYVYWIG